MKRIVVLCLSLAASASAASDYAIVVSQKTRADAGWSKVVDALAKKHTGIVIPFEQSITEALPALRTQFPRYTCFVATPAEAGR
ncbi:hypothetical protein HQ560_11910, partial [bacterium]|nr:hypothetical protein [bacterium]